MLAVLFGAVSGKTQPIMFSGVEVNPGSGSQGSTCMTRCLIAGGNLEGTVAWAVQSTAISHSSLSCLVGSRFKVIHLSHTQSAQHRGSPEMTNRGVPWCHLLIGLDLRQTVSGSTADREKRNVILDQLFKSLHHYRGERHWMVVL